jgi:hypothetical protein
MSTISASTTSTTAFKVTADTTGVLVIQTGVTPTTALTVGSDQSVTFAQAANLPNTFGFKNRLINSAMVIDQRNAGASVSATAGGQYFLDRWSCGISAGSKFTVQQSSTAPAGFNQSSLITSSTAWSLGASDDATYYQYIEGYNIADLGFGSASASTVTLSFWVRSSLTGTFGGILSNTSTRFYPFTYTINAANTFEQKTITIAGDTSGTWLTTTGIGLQVAFSLAAGSSKVGTAGAWTGVAAYQGATGQTNILATNGATWYVTGVQLEKGSTATSFDYRPYGTELQLCYRYYYFLGGETAYQNINTCVWYGAGDAVGQFSYPVAMRANPTMAKSGTWATLGGGGAVAQTLSNDQITTKNVQLGFTGGSGGTSGQATTLRASNDTGLRLTFSAEL